MPTIVTEPLALAVAVGAKVTVNVADWEALIVAGVDKPVTVKPLPVTLSCEIVSVPVPLLVI